jgi:hypothetical protein
VTLREISRVNGRAVLFFHDFDGDKGLGGRGRGNDTFLHFGSTIDYTRGYILTLEEFFEFGDDGVGDANGVLEMIRDGRAAGDELEGHYLCA